jgi:nucleoside-diphosphate-sugar epimerase
MSKIITIIGGSGFFGSRCIQTILNNTKDVKVYSVSRSGKRNNNYFFDQDRVEFIKGDALMPDTFSPIIQKSTGIIHTVGKLISLDNDESHDSYNKVNYESCMKVAQLANDFSSLTKKNFVYISAERGHPFPLSLIFNGYINTKRKTEERLLHDFPNLNTVILRPGFINDSKERPHYLPFYYAANISNFIEKNILNNISPTLGDTLNLPSQGIESDVLSVYAVAGALGKLDMKIISNDYMNDMNNIREIKFDV